jgi:hypothetical protein
MARKLVIGAIVMLVPITVAVWVLLLGNFSGPDTETLAQDISRLDEQIAQAEVDAATYTPSSLAGTQARVRLMVVKTTRDMLEQKRLAWFRGIALHYQIDGLAIRDLSKEEMARLEAERASAKSKADAAHAKAAQYTGGLVQGLAIAEEQTELLTLAFIDLQRVTGRWSIALPRPVETTTTPLGRSTNDKGAL